MARYSGTLLCLLFLSVIVLSGCQEGKTYESQLEEIFPPAEIQFAVLFRLNGFNVGTTDFKEGWSLVKLSGSACDAACENHLNIMNQLDFKNFWVFIDPADTETFKRLSEKYTNVAITAGSTASTTDMFVSAFALQGEEYEERFNYFYWVSPQGEVSFRLPVKLFSRELAEQENLNLSEL